jgi:hypothetical protein
LEEAVRALGSRPRSPLGVFEGRLACGNAVVSPGGVVCAFYEAQLREHGGGGRRGALLSCEAGRGEPLFLKGRLTQVQVEPAGQNILGPTAIRRCRWGGVPGGGLDPQDVLAEGIPPCEAISFERTGKMGESYRVVGHLEWGPNKTLRIAPPLGGAVLLAPSGEVPAAGRALARRAWSFFGGSAGLSTMAALILARAF